MHGNGSKCRAACVLATGNTTAEHLLRLRASDAEQPPTSVVIANPAATAMLRYLPHAHCRFG
jgi:hypothetical protein